MLKDIINQQQSSVSLKKFDGVLDKDGIIPIGKYKGMTIFQLIHCDPEYLWWLINNTNVKIKDNLRKTVEDEVRSIKDCGLPFGDSYDSRDDLPF